MSERFGQLGAYWLSKRPNSEQWCRTWFDAATRQTRRESLGTDDPEEAQLRLADWYARNVKLRDERPQDVLVEWVLTRYYLQYAYAIASAEFVRIAVRKLSFALEGKFVAELTPIVQRQMIADLRAGGASPGYVRRIVGVLASALNWAVREQELTLTPRITLPADGAATDRVLSLDESCALWLATESLHERIFLACAYGTLARPEAILDLRSEFWDRDRGLLTTQPPERALTKKRRPVVKVGKGLRPWLEHAPSGHLVQWRGQRIASFKTAFRAMRRRAGLGEDVVAKTIRHTMATEMRSKGVPEAEVLGWLGHKALSGKGEVYAKYRPEYLRAGVKVIDDYFRRLRASCVLA